MLKYSQALEFCISNICFKVKPQIQEVSESESKRQIEGRGGEENVHSTWRQEGTLISQLG